jgi:TPR repeat protein
MRLIWKIAVPIACLAAIAGTSFAWHAHKTKADAAAKLGEEVRVDRIGAMQGNAEAQTSLSRLYYYGWGVPQDYAEAAQWLRKAADQGYARAEAGLGTIYYEGHGVPQDYVQAAVWYRKAADQGYAKAQDYMGGLYYYGHGVPQDYDEALRWYIKAADQGNARAEYDLGAVYYHGNGAPQNYAEAFRWYRKAADQNDAEAEFAVGYMLRYGQGVPRSFLEGRRWYIKAASQGNQKALLTVNASLTTGNKLSLVVQVVLGLFLVSGLVPFRMNYFAFAAPQKPLTPSDKLMTTAGALILLCSGYEWYGYSHLKFRHLLYGPNLWVFGDWLLEVAGFALIFYAVRLGKRSEERERNADLSGEPQPDAAGN